MNFAEMVTSSVLARAMAIIVLALTLVAAIVVAAVDLLEGHEPPAIIWNILGIGIGTAGTLININFGVVLQPLQQPTSTGTGANNVTHP